MRQSKQQNVYGEVKVDAIREPVPEGTWPFSQRQVAGGFPTCRMQLDLEYDAAEAKKWVECGDDVKDPRAIWVQELNVT